MTDPRERIAEALSAAMARGEAESELRALGEKMQAINVAAEVIYRAVGKWTGLEVKPGEPVPMVRDGIVIGRTSQGIFKKDEVREVAEASLIEHGAELVRKRDALKSLIESLVKFTSAIREMSSLELLHLEHLTGNTNRNAVRGPRTVEERVVREIGAVQSALISSRALLDAAGESLEALEKQIENRSAGRGRPRNEAAHEVARRLAVLYARVTGKRPTYAAGPDGLSGDYTPVLRDVFNALGWTAIDLRGPATKAIDEITEADLKHEINALGRLFTTLSRE